MMQNTEDTTSDLAGIICQPSRMAGSSIRRQKTGGSVALRGVLQKTARHSRDKTSLT